MLSSVASKYEDAVAMVPSTKINSYILHKLFNGVKNGITTISYDGVVSFVEGHSSNVKLHKKEICTYNLNSFIPRSVDQHRFLYLLYDKTHLFKCIYNNFI